MIRCKSCRHWSIESPSQSIELLDGSGWCKRATVEPDANGVQDGPAVVMTNAVKVGPPVFRIYPKGFLVTEPDFGCVLGETKEDQ